MNSERYMPVLDPLLSEFWNDGQSEFWWLLDSGASATFMATSSLNACGAWVADMKHEQFRAANGSKVDMTVLQHSLFGSVFTLVGTRIGCLSTNLPS